MKRPLSFLLGSIALFTGTATPIIPAGEMHLLYSYSQNCNDVTAIVTATTTQQEAFKPDNCQGSFAASVFEDSKGNEYITEIPLARYEMMGQQGGTAHNPTKTEYSSVLKLFMPKKAEAAIAYDTTTSPACVTSTSLTYSHTITGADPILLDGIFSGQTTDPSSVTYNAAALTQQYKQTRSYNNSTYWLYYLQAPSTGANNVVVTFGSSVFICSHSSSYSGVAQTGFPDAAVSTTNPSSNTITGTVTTVADNAWLVAFNVNDAVDITDAMNGANTVSRGTSRNGSRMADSNGAKTPAGSYSQIISLGSTAEWTTFTVSIAPPAAAAAQTHNNSSAWFNAAGI